ncbi:Protein SDS23, partial [Durusdinium trenchii]
VEEERGMAGVARESMVPGHYARDILAESCVGDVVEPQLSGRGALVKATEDEDVLTVCARLADASVSSLPVFSKDDAEKCLGIVDFSDAVAYLLKMDWDSLGSLKHGDSLWEELGSVPIQEAIDLSERNPMMMIPQSASLLDAVKLFDDHKLRRALVEEDDKPGKVVAVLSPSAVVNFLMMKLQGRNDIVMNGTVDELGVGHSPVKSVKKNQSVLEAMHLMHRTQHSVVAVVESSSGALSGSISMSDIKRVFQEKRFSLLIKSTWKFIVEAREQSDTEVFPFFGVYDSDKMSMVVSKLLATNVHHLYVVDTETTAPVRVVSFTDICGALRRNCVV